MISQDIMLRNAFQGGKFQDDLVWSFIAFFFWGIGAVLLNIFIASFYTPAEFGVFSQCYAIFVVASQFSVMGIPISVMKHTAEFNKAPKECSSIICSALLSVFLVSIIAIFILWSSRSILADILKSRDVEIGVFFLLPGLLLLSFNKVFANFFNGMRMMKLFATLQVLRVVFMILCLLIFVSMSINSNRLTLIFTISEFFIFILCLIVVLKNNFICVRSFKKVWIKIHLNFGLKAFPIGLISELNHKVDILILGAFMSDKIVGIYSFSVMFIDGFHMLLNIVKKNIMPLLIVHLSKQKLDETSAFISKIKKKSYIYFTPIAFISMLSYPWWMRIITDNSELLQGWPVFSILVTAVALTSGFLVFNHLFIAASMPGWNTVLFICIISLNIVFNLVLIPFFGMLGAAFATSFSIILLIPLLKIISRNVISNENHII
jgi:O-antigen/teichoic acid export membrane protein